MPDAPTVPRVLTMTLAQDDADIAVFADDPKSSDPVLSEWIERAGRWFVEAAAWRARCAEPSPNPAEAAALAVGRYVIDEMARDGYGSADRPFDYGAWEDLMDVPPERQAAIERVLIPALAARAAQETTGSAAPGDQRTFRRPHHGDHGG